MDARQLGKKARLAHQFGLHKSPRFSATLDQVVAQCCSDLAHQIRNVPHNMGEVDETVGYDKTVIHDETTLSVAEHAFRQDRKEASKLSPKRGDWITAEMQVAASEKWGLQVNFAEQEPLPGGR